MHLAYLRSSARPRLPLRRDTNVSWLAESPALEPSKISPCTRFCARLGSFGSRRYERPLIHTKFQTDGASLFAEHAGRLLDVSATGQAMLSTVPRREPSPHRVGARLPRASLPLGARRNRRRTAEDRRRRPQARLRAADHRRHRHRGSHRRPTPPRWRVHRRARQGLPRRPRAHRGRDPVRDA